jgi:hypothetical protein
MKKKRKMKIGYNYGTDSNASCSIIFGRTSSSKNISCLDDSSNGTTDEPSYTTNNSSLLMAFSGCNRGRQLQHYIVIKHKTKKLQIRKCNFTKR